MYLILEAGCALCKLRFQGMISVPFARISGNAPGELTLLRNSCQDLQPTQVLRSQTWYLASCPPALRAYSAQLTQTVWTPYARTYQPMINVLAAALGAAGGMALRWCLLAFYNPHSKQLTDHYRVRAHSGVWVGRWCYGTASLAYLPVLRGVQRPRRMSFAPFWRCLTGGFACSPCICGGRGLWWGSCAVEALPCGPFCLLSLGIPVGVLCAPFRRRAGGRAGVLCAPFRRFRNRLRGHSCFLCVSEAVGEAVREAVRALL